MHVVTCSGLDRPACMLQLLMGIVKVGCGLGSCSILLSGSHVPYSDLELDLTLGQMLCVGRLQSSERAAYLAVL
eukprot:168411-Amphidinium_carterae.1